MVRNLRLLLTIICLLFLLPLTLSAEDVRREFFTLNASNELADNNAQVIVCTRTGRMIISTLGNLNFYDGSSFTHIDTKKSYQMQLPDYKGDYSLEFDTLHHLWIKYDQTLTCVDLLNEVFITEPEKLTKELGCDGTLLDFYTDDHGGIWFLTEMGICNPALNKVFKPFSDRNLQELDVFDNLLVTFYDNGELIAYDLETEQLIQHTKAYEWDEAHQYMDRTIKRRYRDGFYYVKSGSGGSVLLQYNVRTHQWNTLMTTPYQLHGISENKDKLYITADEGYFVYNTKTAEVKHVTELKLVGGRTLKARCHAIDFDKQGGLWIGTDFRGVLYARPHASPFNIYNSDSPQAKPYVDMMSDVKQNISEFGGNRANCMFKDSRNWTWIGTMTGLYLYRSPKDEPVIFNKKNALLNNVVHSIVEDKNNNIWVGTSYGLSCVLLKDKKIIFTNNFNRSDNIPNESFLNSKAISTSEGRLVFQTIDHVVTFDPDSLAVVNDPHMSIMYPKLIKVLVNGQYVEPHKEVDGNVIIDRAITRVRDIYLNADQNSVSLTFSGLNYYRPIQTYYRVRIKQFDDAWKTYTYYGGLGLVDAGGRLHLPLMGLKPGDYDIEVQASMFPDIWEDARPYMWVLHVNQPWWQRSGVYMLIVGLIFLLLIVNFAMYNKNTRKRVRRNAEEGDMIRKILSFINRCDACDSEILYPVEEELFYAKQSDNLKLPYQFIDVMLRLIPYVHHEKGRVTMRKLSEAGQMDIVNFYDLMTTNLYKSPSELIRVFRIEKGAHLLKTTNKSVAEIAKECGFYTENYFMGSFFHRYKMTPMEYRNDISSEGQD